jgi:hypothetical protein
MARLSTVVSLRLPACALALLGRSLVMPDALAATPLTDIIVRRP